MLFYVPYLVIVVAKRIQKTPHSQESNQNCKGWLENNKVLLQRWSSCMTTTRCRNRSRYYLFNIFENRCIFQERHFGRNGGVTMVDTMSEIFYFRYYYYLFKCEAHKQLLCEVWTSTIILWLFLILILKGRFVPHSLDWVRVALKNYFLSCPSRI